MEQEEYTREEINWSYVEFVDNQDVLDLIEKVRVLHVKVTYSIHEILTHGYYVRACRNREVL